MGRLPVLAAGVAFVLASVACAGNDVSPSAVNDGVGGARRVPENAEARSSKEAPGIPGVQAPRDARKGRPSGAATAGSTQRKRPTSPGRAPATTPLAVTVEDSPSDAEGDVPGFIEVTGADVGARAGELTMGVTVAEAIPDRLAPGEAAMFAFDVETASEQFTVVAQLDHNGISAVLTAGDETTPLAHEVVADGVRISVPWRLLGQDQPPFGWTAGTVMMEIAEDGVSSRGGDSAGAASFPPPATPDEMDEGR